MMSDQNPMAVFRKIVREVRGIEKAEEWKIYMAVAFLSMAISLLFMLYSTYTVWFEQDAAVSVSNKQHITLSGEKISKRAVVAAEVKEARHEKTAESPKTAAADRASAKSGDWYYDEVHKDWRYKNYEKKG